MKERQSNLRPTWLPNDQYPFEIKSIDLDAGQVTYIDEGEGPTLLFVHAGMWSFVFRDVIERLRVDFRCLTLDFPGFGLTPARDQEIGIRDMASFLEQFVIALDLNDLTLVVHDLGGVVGLTMAAEQVDRIRGLALVNTFAWTPDSPGLRAMFRIMGAGPVALFDVATNLIPRLTSTSAGVGRHLDSAGRQAFLGPFRDRSIRHRFHKAMRSVFNDPGLTESVERATRSILNPLPVLTIFGEKNDPFGFQDRHAGTFPNHRGVVVEAGNHFPMMDDPELVASEVRRWHREVVAQPA